MNRAFLILLGLVVPATSLTSACGGDPAPTAEVRADLAVEPASIDFGAVFVGERAQRSVVVRNQSNFAVDLGVAVPEHFAVGTSLVRLPANGEAAVEVQFAPTADGSFEDRIRFRTAGSEVALDVKGIGTTPAISAPVDRVDFGPVPIGQRVAKKLAITNQAQAPLFVTTRIEGDYAPLFGAPESFRLEAKETREIELTYHPRAPVSNDARLLLRGCETCAEQAIRLTGEGARDALFLDPVALDFGSAAVGSTVRRTFEVRNDGDFDREIVEATIVGGGAAPFSAALPAPGTALAGHGGELRIEATFAPTRAGEFHAAIRMQIGSNVLELPLRGVATPALIVAAPERLDFGAVPAGSERTRAVQLSSPAEEDFLVTQVQLEGDAAFSLVSRPELPFDLLQPVDLQVRFQGSARGERAAELVIGTNKAGLELRIPIAAIVVNPDSCSLQASVETLRFGAVAPGTSAERTIVLRNPGPTPCDVWNFRVDGDVHGSFAIFPPAPLPAAIAPGGALAIPVHFAPAERRIDVEHARLLFDASPPGSAPREIALSGLARDPGVVVAPAALDFDEVPLGGAALRTIAIRNEGERSARLTGVLLPAGFAHAGGAAPTRHIGPGGGADLEIGFTPEAIGPRGGDIELLLSGIPEPLLVPVVGVGIDGPCTGACSAPQIACPASIEAPMHATHRLEGAAVGIDAALASCIWTVEQAPAGATAAPEPIEGCHAALRPDAIGRWELRLQATDASGATASCTTELQVVEPPAFFVETTWSGADDFDLHLFHPLAGNPLLAATWFSAPWDCFFGNDQPAWDAPGPGDDPVLVADARTGGGAEQMRIAAPAPGKRYAIGVHWFDARQSPPQQNVTTRIFCGGALVAERVDALDYRGQAVIVGSVEFDDEGRCAFQPSGARLEVVP